MVCRVPSSAFYPCPKVDSAVLHVQLHKQPRIGEGEMERFFRVARAGFAQKRKQIQNSLAHNLHIPREGVLAGLSEAGVTPTRRPQTLTIDEWATLARALPFPGG